LDLAEVKGDRMLASACKALTVKERMCSWVVEGVPDTPAVALLRAPKPPNSVGLGGESLSTWEYSPGEKLLWIRFPNQAAPRELRCTF